jgi:sugar diacid utilization regulator
LRLILTCANISPAQHCRSVYCNTLLRAGQFFHLMDKPGASALLVQQIEINQQLSRLSADDQGIEAIARALAQFAHKAVLIQDKRLQPLAQVPLEDPSNWNDIVEAFQESAYLPHELADRKQAHQVREPIAQSFATCARLVMPIVTRNVARGYVSLIARHPQFEARDRMVASQGALVCAIEMAKVKAVSVAEKKLRGDLIQAVLTQAITEADALGWAERAGFRKTGPYVAVAMQWVGRETPSLRRLETIVNGQIKRQRGRVLASARENEIVALYAVSAERGTGEAEQWAASILNLAGTEFPRATLAIGLGRPVLRLLDMRTSYHEAAQAANLEGRLRHNKPQVYANLGVYRLLLPLSETQELRAFADQVLGKLTASERDKTGLLETLRVYFQCNGNVAQTAKELFIHRNTLLYRLDRIREISGFDLDDAETRLQLQLALRAHELTRDTA